MAKREIYHSTTMGPIPLSFTGRHLMQALREAVTDMMSKAVEKAKRGEAGIGLEWDEVSRARGRIAKYISQLEERPQRTGFGWRDPEPLDVAARRQEADMEFHGTTSMEDAARIYRHGLPPRHFGFNCGGEVRETNAPRTCICGQTLLYGKGHLNCPGAPQNVEQVVLPPIPKGYALHMINGIVSIEPIEQVKVSGKK